MVFVVGFNCCCCCICCYFVHFALAAFVMISKIVENVEGKAKRRLNSKIIFYVKSIYILYINMV